MAETAEHIFLSQEFLRVLEQFSHIKLYGFTEAERKRFDFACVFQRDWERPLVGQTLWKHSEGIDKDIRLLLASSEAHIWSYVIRDTVKNRALIHEVIEDFKKSEYRNQLFKLKLLWIPADFDADSEEMRQIITALLKKQIVNDILFNVIFGRLSADDIKYFLNATGMIGLNLAVLYHIATQGFINYPQLSKSLQVSATALRERVLLLVGCGMLSTLVDASLYFVSLKGRVFLELLRRIIEESQSSTFTSELVYILEGLELSPQIFDSQHLDTELPANWTPLKGYTRLVNTINVAHDRWGLDFDDLRYAYDPTEKIGSDNKKISR